MSLQVLCFLDGEYNLNNLSVYTKIVSFLNCMSLQHHAPKMKRKRYTATAILGIIFTKCIRCDKK